MTPKEQYFRGSNIIDEFAAFNSDEFKEFPMDIDCLKLWLKAKLNNYGADIVENKAMQTAVSMAIESAYRLGKSHASTCKNAH